MTTFFPSDAQIDEAARRYAAQNRCSYAEAASAVVAVAHERYGSAAARPAQRTEAARTVSSDAVLDQLATEHARKHGVSYADALRVVADAAQRHAVTAKAAVTSARTSAAQSDAELHANAVRYASQRGVSYFEAVQHVRGNPGAGGAAYSEIGNVNFSEAVDETLTADALDQPIEIFRAGTHVDSEGVSRTFTLADIQATAKAYKPALHEAPLTLGHPRDDLPAYGWVSSLQATPDGRLLMQAGQVDPKLREMVRTGRYKKRSVSFYPPNDAKNPVPGVWYPRHVGWLGAQPPAVLGMADV